MTGTEYRQIRKAMRLTQAQLAKELGVSQITISDRERGRTPIKLEMILALELVSLDYPDPDRPSYGNEGNAKNP